MIWAIQRQMGGQVVYHDNIFHKERRDDYCMFLSFPREDNDKPTYPPIAKPARYLVSQTSTNGIF